VVICSAPQPWAESAIPSTGEDQQPCSRCDDRPASRPALTGGIQHFVVEQSVNTAAVSHIVRPCSAASTRARRMETRS
jgi:hypothetical protein